ncbi:MAG: hypothetical protein ACTHU0_27215 [Kofleriaceae bacterium]
MIGAFVGPLVAAALVWSGLDFQSVILWSLVPSVISVASIAAMTRDRDHAASPSFTVTRARVGSGGSSAESCCSVSAISRERF